MLAKRKRGRGNKLKEKYAKLNRAEDTIGAIIIDKNGIFKSIILIGNSAVASSSGGPWLHKEGRIGMVSNFGAGSYTDTHYITLKGLTFLDNFAVEHNLCNFKLTVSVTITGDGNLLLK